MVDGRDRDEWSRLAPLIVAICNSNPWREEPVTVRQINPYLIGEPEPQDEGPEIDVADFALAVCGHQAVAVFQEHDKSLAERRA